MQCIIGCLVSTHHSCSKVLRDDDSCFFWQASSFISSHFFNEDITGGGGGGGSGGGGGEYGGHISADINAAKIQCSEYSHRVGESLDSLFSFSDATLYTAKDDSFSSFIYISTIDWS